MGNFWDIGQTYRDVTGQTAAERGQEAQIASAGRANEVLGQQHGLQLGYLNQLAGVGQDALSQLQSGSFANNYQQSPGYAAQLAAGQTAINNGMAARGWGRSGAAMKALTGHSQDLANQDYQQYYNNEANRLGMLAGVSTNATNNLANAAMGYGTQLSNNIMGVGNAQAAAGMSQYQTNMGLLGGLGGAALGGFFSDMNLKTNITPIKRSELDQMRKDLRAFYYEYKDILHGSPGTHIGIMAQDFEKSELGKWSVVEDENKNKMIDLSKVLSIFLATMAEGEAA